MLGIILPRPAMAKRGLPTPWETRMTSGVISTGKGGDAYGYNTGVTNVGALADNTIDPLSNAQIKRISKSSGTLELHLAGNLPNEGWEELLIQTSTFLRESGTYLYLAATSTTVWSFSYSTDPFPNTGSNILVRLS